MSGRVGDLSDKQAEKLAKFKETLKDVITDRHDDIHLLRFLRARQFDLKASEAMFRKDVEWRKKMDVERLKTEFVPPEVLAKYIGGGFIGYDKEGAVIWVDPAGTRDLKGLLKSTKGSDLTKFWIQRYEKFVSVTEEQNKKLGKDVGGLTVIWDLQGFDAGQYLWKPWIDFMKTRMAPIMEQHYPEYLKRGILVNTPKLFMVLYAIIKPVLRDATRKKIIFMGSDWKTQLLTYVDAEVLPVSFGGTRVDPDGDPTCPSVVKPAGPVPKSYYLKGQDISGRCLTVREISPTGTLDFKYEVTKPGSILSFEFRTKNADIGFSVKKIKDDGKKVDIIGKERYNCHISPEEGQVTLEEPGVYVVKFDNSYSFTRSKTLSYFVELLEPIDEDAEPEFQEQEDIEDFSACD